MPVDNEKTGRAKFTQNKQLGLIIFQNNIFEVGIFKLNKCKVQKTLEIIDEKAMRLERKINLFRLTFFFVLMLMDSIGILISGDWSAFGDPTWLVLFFGLIFISGFVHFKTGKAIKQEKVYHFLPFISVNGELLALVFFIHYINKGNLPLPMPINEILIVIGFIVILLNLLGAMRANKGVIIYQSLFLTIMMAWAFGSLPTRSFFTFYIPSFVLISGFFSLWISDILLDSYIANEGLNSSNGELKNANEEITQQNEEITVQRDQIEKQHNQVSQHNKNMTDSMRYAFRIQKAVFPEDSFIEENLPDHFILNRPRDIVSGDFYWMQRNKNKLYVAVADCTGHGVPGAFMSMLGTNMLGDVMNKFAQENKMDKLTPGTILDEVRNKVKTALHQTGRIFEMKDGMDMAVICIDKSTNTLEFAGANNPVFIFRDDDIFHLKPDRMPVAIHRKEKPFQNQSFQLQKNDKLYLFSDGYVDQFGGLEGQKLMSKRFKTKLQEIYTHSMEQQKQELNLYFEQWKGDYEQIDDVLVMGIGID